MWEATEALHDVAMPDRVVEVTVEQRAQLRLDRGGAARLVLITCGGRFDQASLSYDDNIAVTAVPVA